MLSNLFRDFFRRKRQSGATENALDAAVLSAKTLLENNQFQQVIDLLAPVLRQNPGHAEALFMRGTAALELARQPEAMADL